MTLGDGTVEIENRVKRPWILLGPYFHDAVVLT